jgi:hypothetical protein
VYVRRELVYGEKVRSGEADVFEQPLGAWPRQELPERVVAKTGRAFRGSIKRHKR